MNLSRRRFLYLAGAAGATSAGALPRASAQAYPARPLRWIVGFPPSCRESWRRGWRSESANRS